MPNVRNMRQKQQMRHILKWGLRAANPYFVRPRCRQCLRDILAKLPQDKPCGKMNKAT